MSRQRLVGISQSGIDSPWTGLKGRQVWRPLNPSLSSSYARKAEPGIRIEGERLRFILKLIGIICLILNVLLLLNLGLTDSPCRGPRIPPRPQMPAPILSTQLGKLPLQPIGAFVFEILHYFGRREIGRDTDQNMDVIRPNVALDHLHLIGGTDLSDYVPQSQGGSCPPLARIER